ncbi:MAG: hypothetical protein Q8N05_18920 [Bacteroidota bacterium]|nr:hypothetical protein [Bacteroidota bacterium]
MKRISIPAIYLLLFFLNPLSNAVAQQKTIDQKVNALLQIMTLDEKIGQLNQLPATRAGEE